MDGDGGEDDGPKEESTAGVPDTGRENKMKKDSIKCYFDDEEYRRNCGLERHAGTVHEILCS